MKRWAFYLISGLSVAIIATIGVVLYVFSPRTIEKSDPKQGAILQNAVTSIPAASPPKNQIIQVTSTGTPSLKVAQQGMKIQRTVFGGGITFVASDLPISPLRTELEALPPKILAEAIARLTQLNFHINDLDSLHVDKSGMAYYACTFSNTSPTGPAPVSASTDKSLANIPKDNLNYVSSAAMIAPSPPIPGILAEVPITSPPIRHSKPGVTNVLFLDFNGHVITNTAWNKRDSVPRWDCLPFDIDGNTNTFSVTEQECIIRIWERVSEDYAPFNIDVTTEQPIPWTSTTGHALITPETDANGIHCPHFGSGGYAYISPGFGNDNYSYNTANCYSPAFVLPQGNTNTSYANTAEAISHELGHNMGLSHDGFLIPPTTNGYYSGHGSDNVSWAPIMGTGYGKNVTQWSKGEYYGANNTNQDDLADISAKTPYRIDDYGNTNATATLLTASNGIIITASGIIAQNTDVDVLAFVAGVGSLSMTVFPYRCANGAFGGNLDIQARLYNSGGALVASDNPTNATEAIINYRSPTAGMYYLHISNTGTGNPTNSTPTGYTSYGSLGQYFITGKVALVSGLLVKVPSGGETWFKGQTNSIIWESGTNATGNVKIDLYRGGGFAGTLTNSVTNIGTYAWILPGTQVSATNCQIHISSASQTSVWDESDAAFAIAAPATNLFFENFDSSSLLPAGWATTNLSGTFTSWEIQSGGEMGSELDRIPANAYSGVYNGCLFDWSSASDSCRLSTPSINITGYTGTVLRFWHHMRSWISDQDNLNIWVKTNATASWYWLAGFSNSIDSWTQQSLPLPNPGTNYTIAFVGDAKYGHGVCLDDIEILGYPEDSLVTTNNTPLWWLANYNLEPTDNGALSDTDNDGLAAWAEWIAGTSPTQALSVLKLSNSWHTTAGRIVLWSTAPGRTYSVNWATNLLTMPFAPIVSNITTGVYTDTVHTVEQTGFYCIGVQMAP